MTLLLLSLLAACTDKPAATPAAQAAAAAPTRRTANPVAATWRPEEELTGSLDPVAQVQLGFDVPGRIEQLVAQRGALVRKGDAVARLDARMAEAQLAQAEAAVAGARAQLAAGEAGFARVQKLREAGGVSEQQFTDAEGGLLAGRAGVQQAEAAMQLARTNLAWHTLRSPIDGTVTNGPDNAGMLVGAGTPLFLVEDLSALQVKATAPESARWIAEGMDATVLLADGTSLPGKVTRVIPALDPATRRVPVEVRVDSPPAEVRAHAFARVKVVGSTDIQAWSLPSAAVVARPEFCVFLAGDTPTKVPVEVLSIDGETTLVRGALSAEQAVLVDPPRELAG